jgi:bifunctional UDP-N-acetylglucosamine pyrophosphorylase / glucosamine-1-phosphate N-acetyltransferase
LHPFAGRLLIEWQLGTLRRLGVDPIVVVVGHQADLMKAACGPDLLYAHQKEQRGTGDAVLSAAPLIDEIEGSVLILNADLPLLRAATLQRLIDQHHESGADLSMLTATVDDPFAWGRIIRRDGTVTAIVEERDASPAERAVREVNVGVYCVSTGALLPLLRRVTPDNAQGEIYLTDIVAGAVRSGMVVATENVDVREVGQINSRRDLANMERTLRGEINEKWMAAGVTLEDPDTAYIGPDVTIGSDSVIGPNVHLRGATSIGRDCRVDGSAFLTDAKIGDGVHLRFGVVMTEVEVGRECSIGPFAHLRPGTKLGDAVHIGDFVETKNTIVGRGTKANHLAYLGDAEIGRETNIGAGTITCNYDGFRKHRTVIGDRVQVGSDCQLVAPVTVGNDVYVASGTTVRRNAPDGVLVFNAREERQREGWVAARRARDGSPSAKRPKAAKAKPSGARPGKARAKKRPSAKRPTRRANS